MMMSEYDERPLLVAPLVLSREDAHLPVDHHLNHLPVNHHLKLYTQIMSLMQMLVVDSSHHIICRPHFWSQWKSWECQWMANCIPCVRSQRS